MDEIEQRLDELKALGLHRRMRLVSGPQGPRVVLDGRPVLLLCSNNCLGFADHPRVREAAADAGLEAEVDVIVGTLGKALGSYGAYACCSSTIAEYLVNTARSLIFSTALPPPAVAGALAALELLVEQPRRVDKLNDNAAALRAELAREGFADTGSTTQIVPLVLGEARVAMAVCERAIERGVFAQAIRPPTVPEGTSRLRLAVMASHTASELRGAARVLGQAARQAGLRPAGPRSEPFDIEAP